MADIDYSGNLKTRSNLIHPTVNFNFMLRVEGLYDVPCRKIHVIRKDNEYDSIQEGGVNDFVHLIRKPISQPFKLEIERYVGEEFYDPLSLGTKLMFPLFLNVGRYLNPAFFMPDRQYIFTDCEVMGKQYGEMDAERSGLLTETTTIAFSRFFVIDSPFAEEKPLWQFEGYAKEGNGETNRNTSRIRSELTKEQMAKRTQRWSMAQNHGGNETRKDKSISSRQNLLLKGELDKSMQDMWDKAKQWDFDDAGSTLGNKQTSAVTPEMKGYKNDTEATMAANAIQWGFDTESKTNFAGIGDSARANVVPVYDRSGTEIGKAGHGIEEVRSEEMQKNAALWEFDTVNNKEGKGTASRQSNKKMLNEKGEYVDTGIGYEKGTKQDFAKKANLWSFSGNKPTGRGKKSRVNYEDYAKAHSEGKAGGSGVGVKELTRAEMEKKAHLWPKQKSAKQIADFLSKNKEKS